MVERKSKKRTPTKCEICGEKYKKSVSRKKAAKVDGLDVSTAGSSKVHLCKKHYKVYKKATKEERKLKTLTWQ